MSPPSDLAGLQHWMHAAITGDDGPPRGVAVVRSTSGLSADERLSLYHRGYRMRLVDCLRAGYPSLRVALGDELFDAFAADYLREHPSRSYSLAALGAGLPEHLAATRPDTDETWPDFMVDLASFERAVAEVFDGEGAEGRPLLAPGAAPGPDARLRTVPCLRVLRARFPVDDFLRAARRGEDPPLPAPRETRVAVSRRDWVVTFTPLDAAGERALRAIAAGSTLGEAAHAAGLGDEELATAVRGWSACGLFEEMTR